MHAYSHIDTTAAWKKLHFILTSIWPIVYRELSMPLLVHIYIYIYIQMETVIISDPSSNLIWGSMRNTTGKRTNPTILPLAMSKWLGRFNLIMATGAAKETLNICRSGEGEASTGYSCQRIVINVAPIRPNEFIYKYIYIYEESRKNKIIQIWWIYFDGKSTLNVLVGITFIRSLRSCKMLFTQRWEPAEITGEKKMYITKDS